jgi:hypothetical protein
MAVGLSSVVTYAPPASPGAPLTGARWLGSLGPVTGLIYSYVLPGGPDQMACTLMREPDYRTEALNPGRVVQVIRGSAVVWDGKLLEAVPSASGWAITATGLGNAPADFSAVWTTWTNQDDAVNQAIARGLRLSNPGVPSGVWLGSLVDSGAQQVSDLLNLFCTMGGYIWSVTVNPTGGGGSLSVYPFPGGVTGASVPLVPTRLLTCTAPVPRTLGGDINTLWLRYQASADAAAASAVYDLTSTTVTASALKYGPVEDYEDLSSAGDMTSAAVQALGANLLSRYIRASFSAPFTVRQGQLMTAGGQAVDLGSEREGSICQALITDYGYGGEVVPGPLTFLTGAYQFDDTAQTAQVTPFQSLDMSVASMLSAVAARAGGGTGTGAYGGTAGQEQAHKREAARRAARRRLRREHGVHHGGSGAPVPRKRKRRKRK